MPVDEALKRWKFQALPTWLSLVTVVDADGTAVGHAIVHEALNAVVSQLLPLDEHAVAEAVSAILRRDERSIASPKPPSNAAWRTVFFVDYEPWHGASAAPCVNHDGGLESLQRKSELSGTTLRSGEAFTFRGIQFSRLPGLLRLRDGDLQAPMALPADGEYKAEDDYHSMPEILPGMLPGDALDAYERLFHRVQAVAKEHPASPSSLSAWLPRISAELREWKHPQHGTARYAFHRSDLVNIGKTLQQGEPTLMAFPTETVGALAWAFLGSSDALRAVRYSGMETPEFLAFVFLMCLGARGEIASFYSFAHVAPEPRPEPGIAGRIVNFLGDPASRGADERLATTRQSFKKFLVLLESLSFYRGRFLEALNHFLGDWHRIDPRFTMLCHR